MTRSPVVRLRLVGLIAACCVAVPAAAASTEAGRLIAFEDDGDVYVIASNGTGRRELTRGVAKDRDIAWSPDGRRLAFVRDIRIGMDRGDWVTRPAIYVVGIDGSGLRRLSPRGVYAEGPAWSPDGRTLAFARSADVVDGLGTDVWVMRSDGTGARRLTRHRENNNPIWSPDGRRIAFDRSDPSKTVVFVMEADGTDQHASHSPWLAGSDPTWSPRGDQIAFIGSKGRGSLYVVRADGRGPAQRTRGAHWPPWQPPRWSPDGDVIAFGRGYVPAYVYTVRADGTGVRRLVEGTEMVWSPDGKSIAYSGDEGVYIVASSGGKPRVLTEGGSPAWQP